jgi:prepilin-type N-terminal cleavage/methylation domain-containing protein
MKNGFTLVELLTVLAIIFTLTSISIPFYRTAQKQYVLEDAVQKLAQDIRRVEGMGMSAKKLQGAPANFQGGYGIRLEENHSNYILFADFNNNRDYDSGEEIETPSLGQNLQISSLSPGSPLTIVFVPPDPKVIINPSDSLASITVEVIGISGLQRTIKVNKAGLIYVE